LVAILAAVFSEHPPAPSQCNPFAGWRVLSKHYSSLFLMKHFLLLLSSGLLLTGSASAQIGLRVGGNLLGFSNSGRLDGTTSVNTSTRLGYQVGVYYQAALSKRFSVVPEIQFSREQQRVTETSSPFLADASFNSDYRLNLSYLDVPVLLRASLGPVYLEAGPQLSVLVGGRGTGESTYYSWGAGTVHRNIDQAATDRYHRVDAGFCLGVGVKLPAGFGLNVRAYQGLKQFDTDYSNDSVTPIPYWSSKEYRQTLQASLTYQLAAR
jgi:hypothetical protein